MDEKQLSNPFSTGSGGAKFEANIQATFVTLMLSGGYAPCLPAWPIVEIKLQGKVAGYATDDLIVFIGNPSSNERRRLLGQVKHSISVTAAVSNNIFREVVQAAWSDFNNTEVFTKGQDVIALITGPISATDNDGVNGLLEQARHTRDADEFLTQVRRAKFCSNNVRSKLDAFKTQLKFANNNEEVANEDLYEFLKHFHLLGYDLARKGSVVSSLLQSHIAQFNKDIPDKLLYQIVNVVQEFNQNAGTITIDTLPEDLVEHFREPMITHIPRELARQELECITPVQPVTTNWNQHASAQNLALANLIGSWNENIDTDIGVVTQIVGEEYSNWISVLRETLQIHDCPLAYENGIWSFKNRIKSWEELGSRIFNNHLDIFKTAALEVLRSDDPSFELPSEKRYAATIHGKVLPHSDNLREGLVESLALIGSRASYLIHCSQDKANLIVLMSVRELFEESNWIRWGSLNNLLPILSESSPDEFLTAVENAVASTPSPFDTLFEQENSGVFGRNYITGLLWALEGVAWEEAYLSRATIVLAEIASLDPGGNWANRPHNSLTDIFLPWLPHTLASVQKRQAALKTICTEQPAVGWKLLESLLPNQHSTTHGTYKQKWRKKITDDWGKVTPEEYWEQSRFCAELIVEQAGYDIAKLTSLVANYDHLPAPASEEFRNKLTSEDCINLPEEDQVLIWDALCKFIARHRRFHTADWSLENKSLLTLEDIASQFAPSTPSLLNKRLFSEADSYLYEGDGDWEVQQEKLFEIRKTAIADILAEGGLPKIIEFVSTVSNSSIVGQVLADFDLCKLDCELLPNFLDRSGHHLWSFVSAYAWRRRYMGGWQWFDDINKTGWSPQQIALLLCALPFEQNAWDRAAKLLGENECEYWETTNANTYQSDDDAEYAFIKLLEFGRPNAVIEGFGRDLFKKKDINLDLACDTLLALVQSEESSGRVDGYHINEIIKVLQENTATDQDKLLHVEWAYVTLLNRQSEGSPITLENKLASDPSFFCELIQLMYRAEDAEPENDPSEPRRNLATNAYRLLSAWKVVPGVQTDKEFAPDLFSNWLSCVEDTVKVSGHYDVAMIRLGDVLVNAPEGPDGLWIHPVIAEAMNSRERSSLRDGYRTGIHNSRGAHIVDPEAKPEIVLAAKYRQRAEDVENAGYQRLATTLRDVANSYERDAERIISNVRVSY